MSGWGPGWPNCDTSLIVPLTVNGTGFPGGCDGRLHRLFTLLLQETERQGYLLHDGWCWGFGCRAISGTDKPSNHSKGKAIDINAPKNTRGTRGDIPITIVRLFESYGFVWGGRWTWTDPMHFEFSGTVRKARRMTARAEANLADLDYRVQAKKFETIDRAISYLKGKARRGRAGDDFHIRIVRG